MTKRQQQRIKNLLPDGKPRWVRIYDNGGVDAPNGSGDRYKYCRQSAATVSVIADGERSEGLPCG